eukprot:2096429-Pyramimonas_sp.AAC.1
MWGSEGETSPLNDGVATYLGNDGFDSGTDPDTISSDGIEPLEWSDIMQMEGANQRAEHLFWLLQQAKRRWRRFTRKPALRVRRRIRRSFKGKGQGKRGRRRLNGRGITAFVQRLSDD